MWIAWIVWSDRNNMAANRLRLTWFVFTHCIWGNNFINAKNSHLFTPETITAWLSQLQVPSHLAPVPSHYRKVVPALKNIVISFIEITFQIKKYTPSILQIILLEVQKEEKYFLWKNISDIFIDCLIFNIMQIKRVDFSFLFCNQKYW